MEQEETHTGHNMPNPLLTSLATTIQGVMSQDELKKHQWVKFEKFVSEKAREFRTERLKRTMTDTSEWAASSSSEPRRILKVKKKQKN